MRQAWLLLAALLLSGCTTTVYLTYEIATDERSVERQHLDTEIELTVKTRFLESPVKGTGWIEVFCRQGVVVLTGVVEPGSPAGPEAVAIARRMPGVKRVETFFVPSRPSLVSDYTIKLKLGARVVSDWDLRFSQVSSCVLAGHVVLVGVVDREEKATKIVAHARATSGVVGVKSFIQVVPQLATAGAPPR
jgi:osmotically-inducible protein OsmY